MYAHMCNEDAADDSGRHTIEDKMDAEYTSLHKKKRAMY